MLTLTCWPLPLAHVHLRRSSYDPLLAIDQLEVAYDSLISRPIATESEVRKIDGLSLDSAKHPRLITMGGDHTIVLPILRALNKQYGPVSVIRESGRYSTGAALTPRTHVCRPGCASRYM